jgi:hypothetical protein
MWANLQFVWAGSDLEMTDATTFRHFSGGVAPATYGGVETTYPEQVQASKRLYLYTFIAQGDGSRARHCRFYVSFVPAAGERYAAADYGDHEHCAIRIMDLKTHEPAPGLEVHDAGPLSSRFR